MSQWVSVCSRQMKSKAAETTPTNFYSVQLHDIRIAVLKDELTTKLKQFKANYNN